MIVEGVESGTMSVDLKFGKLWHVLRGVFFGGYRLYLKMVVPLGSW